MQTIVLFIYSQTCAERPLSQETTFRHETVFVGPKMWFVIELNLCRETTCDLRPLWCGPLGWSYVTGLTVLGLIHDKSILYKYWLCMRWIRENIDLSHVLIIDRACEVNTYTNQKRKLTTKYIKIGLTLFTVNNPIISCKSPFQKINTS